MNKSLEAVIYGQTRDNFSGGGGTGVSQRVPFAVLSDGSMPVTIISNSEAANVGTTFLHLDDIQLIKVGAYSAAVMIAANPTDTAGDRWRNNGRESILTSSGRTVQTDSADFVNYNWRGVHLIINITGYTAGGLTAVIQGKDLVSGEYYDIARSNVYTSTGVKVLVLGPGVEPKAGTGFADMLPRDWRVRMEVATGDSITYSVGANLMV